MEKILRYALAGLVIAAPLPFGSVPARYAAGLAGACLAVGSLWSVWRIRRGLSPLPWRDPLLISGSLVVLLGVLQTVPVSPGVLERLSPETHSLRARYEPAGDPSGEAAGPAWRPVSLYPWATRQSLLRFAAWLTAALVAADLSSLPASRQVLVAGIVAGGTLQAAYGLYALALCRLLHFRIFGYGAQIAQEQVTGTFINKNHFAGLIEMALPVAIGTAAVAFARLRDAPRWGLAARLAGPGSGPVFTGSAWLLAALTMATALFYSGSRMGVASCLIAFLCVGLGFARRGRERGFLLGGSLVAGAVILFLGQAERESGLLRNFLLSAGEFRADFGRWPIWRETAAMTARFPLLGVGLGSYPYVFPLYRTSGGGLMVGHAHNDYLEWAAGTGIAGAAVALAAGILLWRGLRLRGGPAPGWGPLGPAVLAGFLGLGLHSITDFNLAIPANAFLFAVLAGMVRGWRQPPAPVALAPPGSAARRIAPAVPALLFPVLILCVAAPVLDPPADAGAPESAAAPFAATIRPAGAWLDLLDPGNAERRFRRSAAIARSSLDDLEVLLRLRLEGGEPSPAAVRYVEGRFAEAIRWQTDGLRRQPTSARGHLVLGHLRFSRCVAARLEAGDPECAPEALAGIRTALRLNPVGASLHRGAALFLISLWPALSPEEQGEWLPVLETAARLNPEDGEIEGGLGRIRVAE